MSQMFMGGSWAIGINARAMKYASRWGQSEQHNVGFRLVCDSADQVFRGGGCHGDPRLARVAQRYGVPLSSRAFYLGFRLTREVT